MHRVRAIAFIGAGIVGALALAACGSSGSSGGSGSTAAAGGAGSAPPAATAAAAPAGSAGDALKATSNSSLGTIVADGKGLTVYLYTNDSSHPSKSTCDGSCASAWPPVLAPASGTPALTGVSAGEVGTVTRSDGTKQLTIGGWPIYEYAGDSAPGDVNGQGVGGNWFAITPSGTQAAASGGTGGGAAAPQGGAAYGY